MTFEAFLDHLEKPRRSGKGFLACCPAHDDRSPSLSISGGDDRRILLRCWAGCTAEEIVEALGLTLSDLFEGEQSRESRKHRRRIKATSNQITQAGFYRALLYLKAEAVLEAAKGTDISKLSEDEFDQIMDVVADAILTLNEEKKHEQQVA